METISQFFRRIFDALGNVIAYGLIVILFVAFVGGIFGAKEKSYPPQTPPHGSSGPYGGYGTSYPPQTSPYGNLGPYDYGTSSSSQSADQQHWKQHWDKKLAETQAEAERFRAQIVEAQ